ncbi:MAG: thioredoxin family protein [Patescibacteria group bacterium]|nr:thioredoxin family protein [Patescibacteria group bacterium]
MFKKTMLKKSIFLLAVFSLVFLTACSLKKEKELNLEEAKVKAQQFINDNFMDPSYQVEITNIEEDEQTGLYKFSIDLGDGELVESYISKDGKFLFPQAYDIAELEEALKTDVDQVGGEQAENSEESNSEAGALDSDDSANFDSNAKVVIYFFWGEGCPHCSGQKTAMEAWSSKYPGLEIKSYETWENEDNRQILEQMAEAYGTSVQGVPMTFIGDKYWIGYAETLGVEMENKIKECSEKDCENPGDKIK